MSRYKIDYHPATADDLLSIYDLIEGYAGAEVADRKLSEIEYVTKGLATYPYIGSIRDEVRAGLRSIPAAEKGVVSFIIDEVEKTVLILCISYAGADWMARIKNRG